MRKKKNMPVSQERAFKDLWCGETRKFNHVYSNNLIKWWYLFHRKNKLLLNKEGPWVQRMIKWFTSRTYLPAFLLPWSVYKTCAAHQWPYCSGVLFSPPCTASHAGSVPPPSSWSYACSWESARLRIARESNPSFLLQESHTGGSPPDLEACIHFSVDFFRLQRSLALEARMDLMAGSIPLVGFIHSLHISYGCIGLPKK